MIFSVSYVLHISSLFFFFFFNDTATTEIYTLSLHDALPISLRALPRRGLPLHLELQQPPEPARRRAPPAHATRRVLADRVRHRVGLAARARRREARGEDPAHAGDPPPDARRGHPREGPPHDGAPDRGRGQPRGYGRLPAHGAARPGAGDQVHALPGDAVLRHG